MFGVPESGSLSYPYFLLRNIFLLQSCHMTCEFVFVSFAEQHPVMVEHITADTYSHMRGPHVVVLVYRDMIFRGERRSSYNLHDAEYRFVRMYEDNIVNEPDIVCQPLFHIPSEHFGKILWTTAEVAIILHCLRRSDTPLDIFGSPIVHLFRIVADIKEPHCQPVEVSKVEHSEDLRHLDAERSPMRITVHHLVEDALQPAIFHFP